MRRRFLFSAGFLILAVACAQAPQGGGVLTLEVKNARWPEGGGEGISPPVLKGEGFRIVVTGDDFEPVESLLASDSAGGTLAGIPVGTNRSILVEAMNGTGRVIRRREVRNVEITSSGDNHVTVELFSVPLVTNLADGNLVTHTRLSFQGYAEKGGAIEILDGETPLTDLGTNQTVVYPSSADGSFSFVPPVLTEGPHTFLLQDLVTGEEQVLEVMLVPPGRMPGLFLGSAGRVDAAGSILAGMMTDGGAERSSVVADVITQVKEK